MTDESVERFIRQVSPGAGAARSKLSHHQAAILLLKTKGYSVRQIADYLQTVGVTTSKSNLSAFIRRRAPVPPADKVGSMGSAPRPLPRPDAPVSSEADEAPPTDPQPAPTELPLSSAPVSPTPPVQAFDRQALRKIMESQPDLDYYARIARERKGKKK